MLKYKELLVNSVIITLILLDSPVPGTSSKCATLYNFKSFQGTPRSLADGTKEPYVRQQNFVPQSVTVTSGCSLTIFDVYGTKLKLEQERADLGWNAYQVLDASCCECGRCSGAAKNLGTFCARLYENPNCDGCSGFRLDLKEGNKAKNFGPLDNKMTSVAVRQGCTLTVFSKPNFDGWRHNFSESKDLMGINWYKQISSAICGCSGNEPSGNMQLTAAGPSLPYPYTTTRSPRPVWTLPTVTTSRPVWTLPTVTTSRPVWTLPTVTTSRPVWTLPTVTTSRPVWTLPTVPTTTSRPPMTLPTVPTDTPTNKPPMTLPTVSPEKNNYEETEEETDDDLWSKEEEDDDWFGEAESDEINPIESGESTTTTPKPTTTTTTTTSTTTQTPIISNFWGDNEEEEESDDWDDDW